MKSAQLDATFAALADPTRRAILSRLALGEASVMELAEPFAISQPAISKHIKVLERAGLISRGRDAQRRPCRIDARALQLLVPGTRLKVGSVLLTYHSADSFLAELERRSKL